MHTYKDQRYDKLKTWTVSNFIKSCHDYWYECTRPKQCNWIWALIEPSQSKKNYKCEVLPDKCQLQIIAECRTCAMLRVLGFNQVNTCIVKWTLCRKEIESHLRFVIQNMYWLFHHMFARSPERNSLSSSPRLAPAVIGNGILYKINSIRDGGSTAL